MIPNILDTFCMRKLKTASSALSRQVREAIEISTDRSHCLLNRKEEFSRCLLPTLRAEGPSRAVQEKMREADSSPTLTSAEEEQALAAAKGLYLKRQREAREEDRKATKRIKINNNMWLYSYSNSNPSLVSGGDEQQLREGSPRQGVQAKQRLITTYLSSSSQAPAQDSHSQPTPLPNPGLTVMKSYKSTLISDYFSAASRVEGKVTKVSEKITPPHIARMQIREAKSSITL